MKIPNVTLTNSTKSAVKALLKESKKSHTIEEQMVMTNYYGYLLSKTESDSVNFAKILLGK